MDPRRPVVQISEQRAHPPQVGGLGQRALHPTHYRNLTAGLLAEVADGCDAVAHPPARQRVRRLQPTQVARLGQQRDRAEGQAVIRELDKCAEIGGLTVRVGDRLEDIQLERLLHSEVGGTECAIVLIVSRKWLPNHLCGELHHDVEIGRPVDRFAAQACPDTFVAIQLILPEVDWVWWLLGSASGNSQCPSRCRRPRGRYVWSGMCDRRSESRSR